MQTKTTSQAGRESMTGTHPLTSTQKIACIKLAIDVQAAKYKVSRQFGDLPLQPVQTFGPEAFVSFAKKQLALPEIKFKEKRAITFQEHQRIVEREGNPERRDFYQLCWHLSAISSASWEPKRKSPSKCRQRFPKACRKTSCAR